jgi:hypothetical protein
MSKVEVVHGMANAAYHATKGFISSTTLKKYTESPMAFKFASEQPSENKPWFSFGSLWHDLISSRHPKGEKIEGQYAVVDYPEYMMNKGKAYGETSQAYKDGYIRLKAEHDGKTIIFKEQYEKALRMVDLIFNPTWEHPSSKAFAALFKKGTPEVSYFIENFFPGINIKFRPDLDGPNYILDYKSCSSPLSEFVKAIGDYGYDISAAMYCEGKKEAVQADDDFRFYWLVQEVNPPHDWAIFSAEKILPVGVDKFYKLLEIHRDCMNTGVYPGIASMNKEAAHGIFTPEMPFYKQKLNQLL